VSSAHHHWCHNSTLAADAYKTTKPNSAEDMCCALLQSTFCECWLF